jgi:nitroreductase / dihydropteridine reductase
MDIAKIALGRHTCKAFDPTRKIADADVEQLLTLLRHAPSSVNSQPWHFVVAASEAGKQRMAKATQTHAMYGANGPKILNASHVVAFCARTTFDDVYIETLLDQEEADGRYPNAEARAGQRKSRIFYANLHRLDQRDTRHWMEKQVYLALGTLLLGAAALGIDATPIEGFDPHVLDEELGLREQGLAGVVLAALGYRGADDFNAALPKSRLPAGAVFSML